MKKQRWAESEKRRAEERRSEKRKRKRKEDASAPKRLQSRETLFFQWFVAPEGRKVGSLKRRVVSHLARWEIKNCTPLWRKAHLQVKAKNTSRSEHTWEVEMLNKCTPMLREAPFFPSQNVQSTPCSDHIWKLTCRKSVRRRGAKHASKSKV